MSYEAFSALRSAVLIGTFLIAVMFFVPQSVKKWGLWKKTGKDVHLSTAVAAGVVAFFFLAADFVIFMRMVLGV